MSTQKSARSLGIQWGVSLLLTLACYVIPEQGIYTHQVKLFLTITVFSLALAAFELVPNLVVAVVMSGFWIVAGVADIATVMSSWTTPTMLMLIGAFFISASLEDSGLLKRVAFYLMCKVKGNYFALLMSLMVVSILLNILTFGNAYVIMPPLALGLCISLNGMKKKLGAGIAAAVMLGCATSHAYTYHVAAWGVISQLGAPFLGDDVVTPFSIIIHNWPLFIISVILLWVVSKWYKPEEDLGDIEYFRQHLAKMGPISRREKANAVVLGVLLLYSFTVNLTGLDLNYGFALIPFALFLPFINGATQQTVEKVNFEMLFFVAACMAIGTVATNMGLGDAIAEACLKALGGNTSPWLIIGIIFGIVFILNFLMTPMAIWSLITIPLLTMVTNLGFSALPFAYAINACAEAIIMPYEYVPYLVIFSFGMISMKDFVMFNIVRSIVVLLGIVFVLTGYWHLIGLL